VPALPVAETVPPRPKPSSTGPLLIVGVFLVLLLMAIGGGAFVYHRWIKKTPALADVPSQEEPGETPPQLPQATPAPPDQKSKDTNLGDALRQARLAQEAAERLTAALAEVEPNQKLIEEVLKRANPDPATVEIYRDAGRNIERSIIDAEQSYLLSAKRLGAFPTEMQQEAFDKVEEEVASVGINWRLRLVEYIRQHAPTVSATTVQIEPEFREKLKSLQIR
jgi:hypothetical protein